MSDLADLLRGNDSLSQAAAHFAELAGRELSPAALQCLSFLRAYGSGDLVDTILALKRLQAGTKDVLKLIEALSPAETVKEMIEAQADAYKQKLLG